MLPLSIDVVLKERRDILPSEKENRYTSASKIPKVTSHSVITTLA